MPDKLRIAVLFGGRSAEHEISLVSARNVIAGLDPERYEVTPIGIDRDGRWLLAADASSLLESAPGHLPAALTQDAGQRLAFAPGGQEDPSRLTTGDGSALPPVDVVFPVLHGPYGEDGSVQGLLKVLNLPWVGPGVLGSAAGMDKDVMKRLLRDAGIPNARFTVLRRGGRSLDFDKVQQDLGTPLYVKPANLGSSVGVSRAKDRQELERAIEEAFLYDNKVLVEENIAGREIECAVLGNEEPLASVAGEIIPADGFYSYKAKYIDESGAALEIPAKLPETTLRRIQELSVRVFQVLELEGMSRVDLFLTPDGQLYVNEVNTIPGFTSISMYPKLWEASGLPLPRLLDRLIELALQRRKRDARLRSDVEA